MFVRLYGPAASLFVALMTVIAGAHPLYHVLEGGSVDAVLDYLTAVAAQVAAGRTAS
jgi:hypothetical protein